MRRFCRIEMRSAVTKCAFNPKRVSNSETLTFAVDGRTPQFAVDSSSLCLTACLDADACSVEAGKAARAASGNYAGYFVGTARAVVTPLTGGGEEGDASVAYANLHEITLTTVLSSDNQTQIHLSFTVAADEVTGDKQLILRTTYGNTLTTGMRNVSLLAGMLVSPSYTQMEIAFSNLMDISSSDETVLTVDAATGNISVKAADSATITEKYKGKDETEFTSSLMLRVTDKLILGVSVVEQGEDYINLLLPALAGYVGKITVNVGDTPYLVMDEGFERERMLSVTGLKSETVISFVADGETYEPINVYFTIKQPNLIDDGKTNEVRARGLSGGAIASIAVAFVFSAILIALLALFVFRKDKSVAFKAYYVSLWQKTATAFKRSPAKEQAKVNPVADSTEPKADAADTAKEEKAEDETEN